MTLIELMMALSISSALLIAIAAAFHASANAITHNDAYFRCTQSARVALEQITTEIRRAEAVQVNSANSIQIIRPAGLLEANEIYRQFSYDAPGKRITLQIFHAGGIPGSLYEVAENVTTCNFGPAEMGSDVNHIPIALLIPIQITCSMGGNSVTLSGASAPRRSAGF